MAKLVDLIEFLRQNSWKKWDFRVERKVEREERRGVDREEEGLKLGLDREAFLDREEGLDREDPNMLDSHWILNNWLPFIRRCPSSIYFLIGKLEYSETEREKEGWEIERGAREGGERGERLEWETDVDREGGVDR
jgi:hypothetical protein